MAASRKSSSIRNDQGLLLFLLMSVSALVDTTAAAVAATTVDLGNNNNGNNNSNKDNSFGMSSRSSGGIVDGRMDTNNDIYNYNSDDEGVVTFPLVPYHEQRRRRINESSRRGLEFRDEITEIRPRGISREMLEQGEEPLPESIGSLYQGYGTHYMDLWCGSPPQRQTVIVDTGSGVTAFPCKGCDDCGVPKNHIDALFEPDKSSSFETHHCSSGTCSTRRGACTSKNTCEISMAYAEGSQWKAYEAIDLCYVGGLHNSPLQGDPSMGGYESDTEDMNPYFASNYAFPLLFGCQTKVTGLFKTQLADGIMGMDLRQGESFWSQMFNQGKLKQPKFSLCFSRPNYADRGGTEAGALSLGGTDVRFHSSPMVYSSDANSGKSGFFNVRLRAVYLQNPNDKNVVTIPMSESALNKGSVIVDSGTTDTYFHNEIAVPFANVYQKLTGQKYSNAPKSMTMEEVKALPTIYFQLVGDEVANSQYSAGTVGLVGDSLDPSNPYDVLLAFPPEHYMEYDVDKGKFVARFYVDERGGTVLGANTMMGHDVLFDVVNNRIGWAESSCDYTKLLTDHGYEPLVQPHEEHQTTTDKEDGDDDDDGSDDYYNDDDEPQTPLFKYDIDFDILEFIASCTDTKCRAKTGGAIAGFILFWCCCCRFCCCCCKKPSKAKKRRVVEMEMGSRPTAKIASYSDIPADDGSFDGEFEGDFHDETDDENDE